MLNIGLIANIGLMANIGLITNLVGYARKSGNKYSSSQAEAEAKCNT